MTRNLKSNSRSLAYIFLRQACKATIAIIELGMGLDLLYSAIFFMWTHELNGPLLDKFL